MAHTRAKRNKAAATKANVKAWDADDADADKYDDGVAALRRAKANQAAGIKKRDDAVAAKEAHEKKGYASAHYLKNQ